MDQAVPSRKPATPRPRPVCDAVAERVQALLTDSVRWTAGKQRLTATRLHEMLLAEGKRVGVTVVKDAVAEWKRQRREVFVPLTYRAGDLAEVDFFEVWVDVAGTRRKAWLFLMRLMYSGRDFAWIYERQVHVDRQQALGLYGAMIIHPASPTDDIVADHEYTIQLQEWLIREGLTYPAMPMDGGQPNYFTINGRAFPSTDMIKMKVGETLKVRFIGSNSGFIHPMHIHGGPFVVVARDGETLPPSERFKADTINVGPGQRYDVVWTALKPGKWMIHCHISHHTTNNNTEQDGGGGLMMHIEVEGDPTS